MQVNPIYARSEYRVNSLTVGFVGMTHLGIVSSAAAAAKGFNVICFDPSSELISELNQGSLRVIEPHLKSTIEKNRTRIVFTHIKNDLKKCNLIIVSPDVPTDDLGKSDLGIVSHLLNLAFDSSASHAPVVILSQVPPGFTRPQQRPGRSLYYLVETLIFGRAVERALNPERYIVGCADPSQVLEKPLSQFLNADACPILLMRFESAELAKISINMCLVASVTTANTLAELCEKIGADWSEIVPALKLDKRIGPSSYLTPGLGIAGGNLERDLETVCNLAQTHDTEVGVVHAWLKNSHHRRIWPFRALASLMPDLKDKTIAILGLAYKQDTNSVKNSAAIFLIESLGECRLRHFDPLVGAATVSHSHSYEASSELDACKGADAVLLLTPWDQFRTLTARSMREMMRGSIVIDPYSLLSRKEFLSEGFTYCSLGRPFVNT
jgi:UDPglucose 6-dehydrogenase